MGKISVKHYLNKKVKPIIENENSTEEKKYPIYFYITINRKTIHKPSIIVKYFTESEFEDSNFSDNKIGSLREFLRNEVQTITAICEKFSIEYENGKTNDVVRYLTKRGFEAKDEFINGLNSYIAFYSQSIGYYLHLYTEQQIKNCLFEKLEKTFDLSMFDCPQKMVNFSLNTDKDDDYMTFYENNLDRKTLKLYCFREILSELEFLKGGIYGYGLTLIEWINGTAQDYISENINSPQLEGRLETMNDMRICLKIDKIYFESDIKQIISEIISPNYQIQISISK